MTVTASSVVAVEINPPKCRTPIAALFGTTSQEGRKRVSCRMTSFGGNAVISQLFQRRFKTFCTDLWCFRGRMSSISHAQRQKEKTFLVANIFQREFNHIAISFFSTLTFAIFSKFVTGTRPGTCPVTEGWCHTRQLHLKSVNSGTQTEPRR